MDALLILFACFVFAFFTGGIAQAKGRSTLGWFILGFLFPILAMLAVGLMPNIKGEANKPTPKTHVKCPDCKELVMRDAIKCKHCGASLVPYNTRTRECPECKRVTEIGYGQCSYCRHSLP